MKTLSEFAKYELKCAEINLGHARTRQNVPVADLLNLATKVEHWIIINKLVEEYEERCNG